MANENLKNLRLSVGGSLGQAHRSVIGAALGAAALFFSIVAVLINTPVLFYMGTALIATIAASRLQAWLSVRALRFERVVPEQVRVGDTVTIRIIVWSDRKLRRPLITVQDNLPPRLLHDSLTNSTPIAPALDQPIEAQYRFRPLKRGVFRWSGIAAIGTDALGLVVMAKAYDTDPVEMVVLPRPIHLSLDIPHASGWGLSEAESGQSRGIGLEPRGVREYAVGDSLRHVHWASTARRGQLLVKEFEAGSHAIASLILQRERGSEYGVGAKTSFELMCGHASFLSQQLMSTGAKVTFPQAEQAGSKLSGQERQDEVDLLIARMDADSSESLGSELLRIVDTLTPGGVLFAFMTNRDETFVQAASQVRSMGVQVVAVLYDPNEFQKGVHTKSCRSPEFIESLEAVGVHTRPVSGVEFVNG